MICCIVPILTQRSMGDQKKATTLGKSWYEASSHKFSGPPEILEFEGDHGQVVRVHKMVPENRSAKNADKAVLYLHGGGFCFGSAKSTYCVSAPVANLCEFFQRFSVDTDPDRYARCVFEQLRASLSQDEEQRGRC